MFNVTFQEWIHCVPCHESGVDPLCPLPGIRSGSTVSHVMNQEWIHCVPCHESGVDLLCLVPCIRSGSTASCRVLLLSLSASVLILVIFGEFIKYKNTNHFIKNNCVWVVFPSSLGRLEIQVTLHSIFRIFKLKFFLMFFCGEVCTFCCV